MIIHDTSLLCGVAVMLEYRCQTSLSQVFDNRGNGLLNKVHLCHIVCTGCMFIRSRCTYQTCEKCCFFESLIFLKKCGTQKMRFSRDSNMFRYRCFGWMTLSRDRGFGDDGRCSDQNSTSQVFKNCGCAFLSETIVCHIVCTNCVSVLLICT